MTTKKPFWFTEEDDQIIAYYMRDIPTVKDPALHKTILGRCQLIRDRYLPHRTDTGIRDRWYILIGRRDFKVKYDIAKLLSRSQRKRVTLRIPVPSTRTIKGS